MEMLWVKVEGDGMKLGFWKDCEGLVNEWYGCVEGEERMKNMDAVWETEVR